MQISSLFVGGVLSLHHSMVAVDAGGDYAMYVWTDGFDATAPECEGVYPSHTDVDRGACFQHAWETPEAREHLFASCNIPDRKVTRIFLSDSKDRIENNGKNANGNCDAALVTLLAEAHGHGIEVYALFAASDAAFSEQDMAPYPFQFNDACRESSGAFFDGVAVNNEYFTHVKGNTPENVVKQLGVLDALHRTASNAGSLPLHFSVSWNWHCYDCSPSSYAERNLTWSGVEKNALEHMMDIADSVDVQVSWNQGSVMAKRSEKPYKYWEENIKEGGSNTTNFYVLAYTNPLSDCRLTFAPHKEGSTTATDSCASGNRTQGGMFDDFDTIEETETYARGGIHYQGGVFSSGMPGWPKHMLSGE